MAKERPKFIAAIVDKLGGKGGEEKPEGESESYSDDDAAKEAAAAEFRAALKGDDDMELYRAFEALLEHCQGE